MRTKIPGQMPTCTRLGRRGANVVRGPGRFAISPLPEGGVRLEHAPKALLDEILANASSGGDWALSKRCLTRLESAAKNTKGSGRLNLTGKGITVPMIRSCRSCPK